MIFRMIRELIFEHTVVLEEAPIRNDDEELPAEARRTWENVDEAFGEDEDNWWYGYPGN